MNSSSKHEKLCKHTLEFLYARTILELLPEIVKENCYGCEVNHPSQTSHPCLMWTEYEHLECYFNVCKAKICEKDIIRKFTEQVEIMDIDEDLKNSFISNIDDWFLLHKPNSEDIKDICARLLALEHRI